MVVVIPTLSSPGVYRNLVSLLESLVTRTEEGVCLRILPRRIPDLSTERLGTVGSLGVTRILDVTHNLLIFVF